MTRQATARRRFQLEQLETRTVPSTFAVTTLSPTGPGSLRDAVAQSNSNPGDDTITFAFNLARGTIVFDNTPGAFTVDPLYGRTALILTDTVTIYGSGVTLSGAGLNRLFVFEGANKSYTLSDLTLTQGMAQGNAGGTGVGGGGGSLGAGGAMYNDSEIFLYRVAFVGNVAVGGTGGAGGGDAGTGGGGGGAGLSAAGAANAGNNGGAGGGQNGGAGGVNSFGNTNGKSGGIGGGGGGGYEGFQGGSGGLGGGGGGAGGAAGPSAVGGGGGFGGGGGGGTTGGVGGFGAGAGAGTSAPTHTFAGGGGLGAGGAIFNRGFIFMYQCTLANNTARGGLAGGAGAGDGHGYGGAIFSYGAYVEAHFCTFADNRAENAQGSATGQTGSAFMVFGQLNDGASVTNTYFYGAAFGSNSGGPDVANWAQNNGNASITGNAQQPNVLAQAIDSQAFGSGQVHNTTPVIVADPLLGPLQDNGGFTQTMMPLPGSPLLNTDHFSASPFGPPREEMTDGRGVGRDPLSQDAGAVEVQHPLSPLGVPVDPYVLYGPHPSASQNEAFVKGLYEATLLRAGSPQEVAYYVAALNNGTLTRAQAAANFYNSPENRGNQVRFFYRYFLKREPSQAEVNYYVGYLQQGIDEGVIMQNFVLSPEYTGQNNDTQFANTMYYAILGRGASPAEINYYVSALGSGQVTRAQVLQNFLRSPEGIERVVNSDYVAYLKRVPSSTELNAPVAGLQSYSKTFGSVAIAILSSDEFYNNAGRNL